MKNPPESQPIEETKPLLFEELKRCQDEKIQELRKKVLDLTKDPRPFENIAVKLSQWDATHKILCNLELDKKNYPEKTQKIQQEKSKYSKPLMPSIKECYLLHIEDEKKRKQVKNEAKEAIKQIWNIKNEILAYDLIIKTQKLPKDVRLFIEKNWQKDKFRPQDIIISDVLSVLEIRYCLPPTEFAELIKSTQTKFEKKAQPRLELTKLDSFVTIETNLNKQFHTSLATILTETKYRKFELLINQQLSEWKQCQEQINSLESEREILKNQIKNEYNAELSEALKKIGDNKSRLTQKQRPGIDAADYLKEITSLNLEKTPEEIQTIIKTTNKELEEILTNQRGLQLFKNIIDTKTLPIQVRRLLHKDQKKIRKSNDLSGEILDQLNLPKNFSLPKEIMELVQAKLKYFEEPQQKENIDQNQEYLFSKTSESTQPKLDQKRQETNTEQTNNLQKALTIKETFPSTISNSKTLVNKNTNDVIPKPLTKERRSSIKNSSIFTITRQQFNPDTQGHNNNSNEIDPKPLKGDHPSSITSELIKFDSFVTIEPNLNEQIYTKIATILKDTKYRVFELLINQQLSKWLQYQEQIDSLESERKKLKNPIKNESNAEVTEPLKKIRETKSRVKQKQQRTRIDAADYSEQIKLVNTDKTPEQIKTIIKTTNKELEEIWTTKRVLQLFKNIIDTKTLPFEDSAFLDRNVKRRSASKTLVVEILDRLGIPGTYSLPLEILKLVLPNFEEAKQQPPQEENQKSSEKFQFKEEQKALIKEDRTSSGNSKIPPYQIGLFNQSSRSPAKSGIPTVSELISSKNTYQIDSSPSEIIIDSDHDFDINEDPRKMRQKH